MSGKPQSNTRAKSFLPKAKVPAPKKDAGGGGADTSHGLVFHLAIAMLLLFSLKEISQADLAFEYHIWLEKSGYGKFDDIVVRYRKPGEGWIEICVQCKHGAEKTDPDGSKTVNNVTAEDLLSGKNKSFSLVEYIKSFAEIKDKSVGCETYYVILTNRAYVEDKDCNYPFFQREEICDEIQVKSLLFLDKCSFKVKYSKDLLEFILKRNVIDIDENLLKDFCSKFLYVYDARDLQKELQLKLAKHCNRNEEKIKSLKARLYYLVSQMYQHKLDPNQKDLHIEFHGRNIFYNIPNVCTQFTGREKDIQIIKEALECEKKSNIFDLLVTGMAGMGKTQIVRKYVDDNKENYKHVVWINAENKESLEHSFVDLARSCQLISSNGEFEISAVITTVYSYFREHTLFVFDNTDKILLCKNDQNEYIYLPNDDETRSNHFIIISQDQQWTTNHPRVTVDKFSEEDALLYFDNSIECSREDKIKLAAMYQYWPLALSLAVSYIKLETENTLGSITSSDVINALQVDSEKFLAHLPEDQEMVSYTANLQSLWTQIRRKLQLKNELSLKIIDILSFSEPDNFPLQLLKFDGLCEDEVHIAVKSLLNNSLVTLSDYKITIHRTLQSVIRNETVKDFQAFEGVLLLGSECFSSYLQKLDSHEIFKYDGNNHMVTFLNHICVSQIELQKYIAMSKHLLSKLNMCQDFFFYCEPNGIFERMLLIVKEKLGDNDLETLCMLYMKAEMSYRIGKYDDSLHLFSKLIEFYTENLGKNDSRTLTVMHEKALVLNYLGKYKEALGIFDHVIESESKILGATHPDTLASMNNKASVLNNIRNYEEALSIYDHIIGIEVEMLGNNHTTVLNSMLNKALVLSNLGKGEEALGICDLVIRKRTDVLGEKHPGTLTSMHIKALVLSRITKFEEALCLYNHIIRIEIEILGNYHPSILLSMHNKATVLSKLGEYEEALSIFNHVLEARREILGENHYDTLRSINSKAKVLNAIGKCDESLKLYNPLFEIQTKMTLLENQPFPTLTNIHSKASVLNVMWKIDEAANIYNHVLEIKKYILGEKHCDTVDDMNNKASVLTDMGKYEEALCIYNQLIEIKSKILGENHHEVLSSMQNKATLFLRMGKHEEAVCIYNHVIEAGKKVLGENNPNILTALENQALVLCDMENNEDLLCIYNHEIEIRIKMLGEKHPDTLVTMNNKAYVLGKMGKYEESLCAYNHVVKARTEILGMHHPDTITSMQKRALVLNKIGKHDEALSICNHVIKARTELLGKNHPDTLTSMHNKASVLNAMGKYEEALNTYDHVIEARTEILGGDHPYTVKSINCRKEVFNEMKVNCTTQQLNK